MNSEPNIVYVSPLQFKQLQDLCYQFRLDGNEWKFGFECCLLLGINFEDQLVTRKSWEVKVIWSLENNDYPNEK